LYELKPRTLWVATTDLVGLLALLSCYLIDLCPPSYTGVATVILYALLTVWMLAYWRLARESSNTYIDLERYLWDGAVLLNGFDPYVVAPDNPVIAQLRTVWPTPEEHAVYPTLYPPIALSLFALSALAGPVAGVFVWKFLATAASIATLLLMANILKTLKGESALPLIALSPLMLLEVGIGGHIDVVTSLCLVSALWALLHAKWMIVGLALGLGAGVKLLPVVLFAPLVIALPLRSSLITVTGGALGLLSCYGTAFALGLTPVGALGVFFAKWEFGSPIYSLLQASSLITNPRLALLTRAVIASLFALWRTRTDLISGMMAMLAVPLLLSPVVFPWYLLVLVPFLALRPNGFLLIWLSLAPLSYEVLNRFVAEGIWQPANWPLWCIGLGWLVGIATFRLFPRSQTLEWPGR